MNNPWVMRRAVKTPSPGATASSEVGIESKTRLTNMPLRRSMWRLNKATPRPATAIPIVLALTAKPIAAGLTW